MGTLFVIIGPTGVGKTDISIRAAKILGCSIVSCDSRQIYKELKIGTAAPTEEQLDAVPHHFIGTKSITDYYSSGQFELDAIQEIEQEIANNGSVLMVGGSMLYVDAVCKGIDDIPNIDDDVRNDVKLLYENEGIEGLRKMLRTLDPEHYEVVDLKNAKRIMHAIEVCIMTGKTFTELRTNTKKQRRFEIVKIGLNRSREELYERINQRVLQMMELGLEEEARRYYFYKDLNSLNTVGYKELFKYFDGEWTRDFAINMIQQNSRRYAKKQLTWFKRDNEIRWFHPNDEDAILSYIKIML